jgi:AcrR family transcriptional regulator
MPRPKTGDKRAYILRAATAMIAEDGIGASTARIAKTAAVAEGSLFRYFPDKDTLLNELYIDLKADLRHTTVKEFPVTASLRKRLQHIWDTYIRWGTESPEKRKAMAQLNVSERITDHSRLQGRVGMEDAVEALEELIARGKLNGMPMTFVADLLVAMAETTMTAMVTNPDAADHYRATGFSAFWSAAGKK